MLSFVRKNFLYITFVMVVLPVLILGYNQSGMPWYSGIVLLMLAMLLYAEIHLCSNWVFKKILKKYEHARESR